MGLAGLEMGPALQANVDLVRVDVGRVRFAEPETANTSESD